jgi:hypothetical protein
VPTEFRNNRARLGGPAAWQLRRRYSAVPPTPHPTELASVACCLTATSESLPWRNSISQERSKRAFPQPLILQLRQLHSGVATEPGHFLFGNQPLTERNQALQSLRPLPEKLVFASGSPLELATVVTLLESTDRKSHSLGCSRFSRGTCSTRCGTWRRKHFVLSQLLTGKDSRKAAGH